MPKEASEPARPPEKSHHEVVAKVLSMRLEQHAQDPVRRVKTRPAANTYDDVEDLWDNVPV